MIVGPAGNTSIRGRNVPVITVLDWRRKITQVRDIAYLLRQVKISI